jgi:hypothetical protein
LAFVSCQNQIPKKTSFYISEQNSVDEPEVQVSLEKWVVLPQGDNLVK